MLELDIEERSAPFFVFCFFFLATPHFLVELCPLSPVSPKLLLMSKTKEDSLSLYNREKRGIDEAKLGFVAVVVVEETGKTLKPFLPPPNSLSFPPTLSFSLSVNRNSITPSPPPSAHKRKRSKMKVKLKQRRTTASCP
jgi:hypothetical protein